MATADSAYAQRTTVLLGSLASNGAIWKTLLCRLSWVSIFNLEEKKITALLFGCIKIYGAGWFPGCCSCRALLWWCMLVTCHQRRRAPMIHCSNKSFVIHPCLDSCPGLSLSCTLLQGALAQNKFHVLVLPRASLDPCVSFYYLWEKGVTMVGIKFWWGIFRLQMPWGPPVMIVNRGWLVSEYLRTLRSHP